METLFVSSAQVTSFGLKRSKSALPVETPLTAVNTAQEECAEPAKLASTSPGTAWPVSLTSQTVMTLFQQDMEETRKTTTSARPALRASSGTTSLIAALLVLSNSISSAMSALLTSAQVVREERCQTSWETLADLESITAQFLMRLNQRAEC